jgi:hypothetical protein
MLRWDDMSPSATPPLGDISSQQEDIRYVSLHLRQRLYKADKKNLMRQASEELVFFIFQIGLFLLFFKDKGQT